MEIKSEIGIVAYGISIPRLRIKIKEIANHWDADANLVIKSLGIKEKSVPALDEDTISLAVNAAYSALTKINKKVEIGSIYTGSESHPYSVKSSSAIIGQALDLGNNYTAADLEFACKAGTAAIQITAGLVGSGMINYGLAIGADVAQSRPGDVLEYAAAAAGAAYIIGGKKSKIIARLLHTSSYTSDTPDFWRREHQPYPTHAGRFSGEPAYFKHITSAVKRTLAETGLKIGDFDHVVFHMPNASYPKKVAKILQVSEKQLNAGFVVPELGNTYSACSLVGLASVLDQAKPRDKILVCSYGSGSGSDCLVFEITNNIVKFTRKNSVQKQLSDKHYVSYSKYLRNLNKLKK